MRLYVVGSEGQVARSLRENAPLDENIVFGFSGRAEVDLLNPSSIERALAKFRPDVVVNPAAYTAVDKAESEPDQAFALNRDGARAPEAGRAPPLSELWCVRSCCRKERRPMMFGERVARVSFRYC